MSESTTNLTSERSVSKRKRFVAAVANKVVFPSLIPAVIGLLIWGTQTRIQQKVDSNSQELRNQIALSQELYKQRLTLSEEYYKRRMDAYDETCKQMTEFTDALDDVPLHSDHAADSLKNLYKFQRSNALYISKDLDDDLSNLWKLGANIMQYPDGDNEQWKSQIPKTIMLSHTHMKEDLNLKELVEAIQNSGLKATSNASGPSK